MVSGMKKRCTVGNKRRNKMKRSRFVTLLIVGAAAAVFLTVFYIMFSRQINSVVIEEMGDRFIVAVYQLPERIRIPVVYEPGVLETELKRYRWLKPLLFTRFGIDDHIPRDEWGEYATFEWNEKIYAQMTKKCELLRSTFLGKDKTSVAGVGVRIEIGEVVICKTEKVRGMEIYLKVVTSDGKYNGGEYHKLVDFQGKWKRTPDKDEGRYATQLINCYEKAMKLVAEGKLKTNPIRKLR